MNLAELPTEVISRICRLMGLKSMRMLDKRRLIYYENRDFNALRWTCNVGPIRLLQASTV